MISLLSMKVLLIEDILNSGLGFLVIVLITCVSIASPSAMFLGLLRIVWSLPRGNARTLKKGSQLFLSGLLSPIVLAEVVQGIADAGPIQLLKPAGVDFDFSLLVILLGGGTAVFATYRGMGLLVEKCGDVIAGLMSAITVAKEKSLRQRLEQRETNLREVQGIKYAILHGLVTDEQLMTMSPDELQARIDADNPFAEILSSCLQALEGYRFMEVMSKTDKARFARLRKQVRELREAPEVIRARSLAASTDKALADGEEALKLLRELPED